MRTLFITCLYLIFIIIRIVAVSKIIDQTVCQYDLDLDYRLPN